MWRSQRGEGVREHKTWEETSWVIYITGKSGIILEPVPEVATRGASGAVRAEHI